MKLKLACADFTFPLLTHDQALDVIAMLGFDGADIGLFQGRSHLQPADQFADVSISARQLRQKLDARELKCADVFLQMDPDLGAFAINHPEVSRRQKAREWFERTLEYATACGCGHVTALPGVAFDGVDVSDSFKLSCAELSWRVERARQANLVFGIEAHVGSIVPTPREALRLVQAVPGLTLTLDYTHFAYVGLPDNEVEPLLAHASHFHVRGACRDRLQTSFKNNVIDYRRIVQVMNERKYPGYVGIEYVWTDWQHCNECDNLSETILFRDYLRSLEGQATGAEGRGGGK